MHSYDVNLINGSFCMYFCLIKKSKETSSNFTALSQNPVHLKDAAWSKASRFCQCQCSNQCPKTSYKQVNFNKMLCLQHCMCTKKDKIFPNKNC